jgi:hypothetical protein
MLNSGGYWTGVHLNPIGNDAWQSCIETQRTTMTPAAEHLRPPPRRLTLNVKTDQDQHFARNGFVSLRVHYKDLTNEQSAWVKNAMADAVTVLHALRSEGLRDAGEELAAAFAISATDLMAINASAADNERWHESVLRHLRWIDFAEAHLRCSNGPWNPRQDLLVLSHQGKLHVPSFQFNLDDGPASIWVTLIHALRTPTSAATDWDVLGWLLRPHPLLNNQPPIMMYEQMPAKVRDLAQSAAAEGRV